MARQRKNNSRKPDPKANGAHNTHPMAGKNTCVQDEAGGKIRFQDQGTQQRRGRGGRRGYGDMRSMSPEREDFHGEQQANHRDNRRSRTPLLARDTRGTSIETQQVRGSAITDAMDQIPAKRKREASDDVGLDVNKKTHRGSEAVQPTTVTMVPGDGIALVVSKYESAQKEVISLAAIKKMSEEERRKLREAKFGRQTTESSKGFVKTKAASQESKPAAPTHGVKDNGKTTPLPETESTPKAPTPHTPNQKSIESTVSYAATSSKITTTDLHVEYANRATATTPKSQEQGVEKTAYQMESSKFENRKADDETAHHSPASIQADIPPTKRSKRKYEGVEGSEGTLRKKAKVNFDAIERRNAKIKKSLDDHHLHAERDCFPEEGVTFVDYDAYSIPLLCSQSIEHQFPFEILDRPSDKLKRSFNSESEEEVFSRKMLVLRQEALRLFRKKFWSSDDLGRKETSKIEPTKVISDCDLYLYNGKAHVATERGLLLTAVYLKIIGVPDTQPVRFYGHRPAWMRLITANPERRHVLETWNPIAALRDGGCITITCGSTVVVYEHGVFDIDTTTGAESRMAYGMREEDCVAGWFEYSKTCRIDWFEDSEKIAAAKLDPSIIDWAIFDFGPLAARATAQQMAQSKPTATVQETATVDESRVSPPPIAQESVPSIFEESIVASPTAVAVQATSNFERQTIKQVLVAKGSERPASNAESFNSCVLQEDNTLPILSIAGGPISRHDSPNSRSNSTTSEGSGDFFDEYNASQGTITTTLPRQAAYIRPVVVQEIGKDPFSRPRQALPGFDGPGRYQASSREPAALISPVIRSSEPPSTVSTRHDVEVDWDDEI
jgi:hypothetical protein